MGDILFIAVLAVIIGLVVRHMVKNHKKGGSCSCGGNCSHCKSCK